MNTSRQVLAVHEIWYSSINRNFILNSQDVSSTSSSRKRPDNVLLHLGKSAKKGFLVEIVLDLIETEGSQDDDVNPILAPIYVRLRDLKNRLFDFQLVYRASKTWGV